MKGLLHRSTGNVSGLAQTAGPRQDARLAFRNPVFRNGSSASLRHHRLHFFAITCMEGQIVTEHQELIDIESLFPGALENPPGFRVLAEIREVGRKVVANDRLIRLKFDRLAGFRDRAPELAEGPKNL